MCSKLQPAVQVLHLAECRQVHNHDAYVDQTVCCHKRVHRKLCSSGCMWGVQLKSPTSCPPLGMMMTYIGLAVHAEQH